MRDVVAEGRASGATYRDKVQTVLQSSIVITIGAWCRRILRLDLTRHQRPASADAEALELLRQYAGRKQRFYDAEEEVPLDGVIPRAERSRVVEQTRKGSARALHRGMRSRSCRPAGAPAV